MDSRFLVDDIKILRKLVSEYGKIYSNLNQITKHFNAGGAHSLALEAEILQCISELFYLRKEVLKMAGEFNSHSKSHQKSYCKLLQLLNALLFQHNETENKTTGNPNGLPVILYKTIYLLAHLLEQNPFPS